MAAFNVLVLAHPTLTQTWGTQGGSLGTKEKLQKQHTGFYSEAALYRP